MYEADKCNTLLLLDKIQFAEVDFKKDLDLLEHQCNLAKQKQMPINADTKKNLGLLNIDLDFALAKLDEVSGDDEVKSMRKRMVENFGVYVIRIDALLKECVATPSSH